MILYLLKEHLSKVLLVLIFFNTLFVIQINAENKDFVLVDSKVLPGPKNDGVLTAYLVYFTSINNRKTIIDHCNKQIDAGFEGNKYVKMILTNVYYFNDKSNTPKIDPKKLELFESKYDKFLVGQCNSYANKKREHWVSKSLKD